jgi:hypothetical protein
MKPITTKDYPPPQTGQLAIDKTIKDKAMGKTYPIGV